ncbi:MAG: dTDP-4-dehydrorhamnose reductase [SAR324 cluster bacterium]|nr:dTDP-4-dehydrorhamnose reductase [SAR324 cluster bacterium]
MKIIIAGANGMLAQDIIKILHSYPEFNVYPHNEFELDITSVESIHNALKRIEPDVLINCAAYTQVDVAENDEKKAFLINETGVEYLAKECSEFHCKLIHFSTDFVFDGTASTPYKENDIAGPLSVYGKSKLAGEIKIQQFANSYLIIRTSWLYGVNGNNFVKTMLRLARDRDLLKVVHDQTGCPTWSADLAEATLELIKVDATGIVHFSNSGPCTWYDLARNTIDMAYESSIISRVTTIHAIPSKEYPTPARRPAYSVLDCSQYKQLTGKNPPFWKDSLKQMLLEFKSHSKVF